MLLNADAAGEAFDEGAGHADVGDDNLAYARLGFEREQAGLERGEGDRDVGTDCDAGRGAGLGVEAAGDVGGDDDAALGAKVVDGGDGAGDGSVGAAGKAGPDETIHDDGGNTASGAEAADGRAEVAVGSIKAAQGRFGADGVLGGDVGVWARCADADRDGADVGVVEVAEKGEPIAAVVAGAAHDENAGVSLGLGEFGESVKDDLGEFAAGVLHEDERGEAELGGGKAIKLACGGNVEDEEFGSVEGRAALTNGRVGARKGIVALVAGHGGSLAELCATSGALRRYLGGSDDGTNQLSSSDDGSGAGAGQPAYTLVAWDARTWISGRGVCFVSWNAAVHAGA